MRIGLPLMVLTSLSLHLIAALIFLLGSNRSARFAPINTKNAPGPAIVISRQLEPERTPPSPPPKTTPAPSGIAAVPVASRPAPSPPPPLDPATILAGGGGPRLDGGVVYVLDISGSMYEAFRGSNRLALARELLARQIKALPDGTPFAVTLYGETTRRSGPLVAASDATRAAAIAYVEEDFDCGGGTNLPAGLGVAEDLHPDRLVVVTDGDLNIAEKKLLTDTRLILGRHGPHLAVIAIAPRPRTDDERLLLDLAHQQEGSYRAVGDEPTPR